MSVDNSEVVDLVVLSPKGDEVFLIMVEARDWRATPTGIEELRAKFHAYARFVISGSLVRQYPEMATKSIAIRLDHFGTMIEPVAAELRFWASKLSRIPVGVYSHRMYWSRVITFFRKLGGASQERDMIRWMPDPGLITTPLLTRSQFTHEFAAVLRSRIPTVEVQVISESQINLKMPDKKDSGGFLDNAYAHYMLAPEQKEDIIEKYIAGFHETTERINATIDRNRIVPILKDSAWIEGINRGLKAGGREKPLSSVHESYNEDLTIFYAEDNPTSVHYLTPENLTELNLGLKELRPLACSNLKRLLPDPDIQPNQGLYRIFAGADYDACLLLLDEFWNVAKLEVEGELIAAVPARDFLAVTGSRNADNVARLKQVAESVASEAPYRLTTKLFVRRQGKFVPYET